MTCNVTILRRNDVKSQKMEYFGRLSCIELKLCTVVTLITKFRNMSTVTLPWQQNGLQALSIKKVKSEFSFNQQVLLAVVVYAVRVGEYGHYSAQTQESPLDSGETNKAFFLLRR